MCVAIAKPAGAKTPKEATLYNCWYSNRDGIGIAYVKDGSVTIKKDFESYTIFISWFYQHIHKQTACLIHFRLATSGLVDCGNRHPFPVVSNPIDMRRSNMTTDLAVIHNGVIIPYSGDKKFSDTQLFIAKVLADPDVRPALYGTIMNELISEYIGRGNKLALLNGAGEIALIGEFVKEHGVFFSNHQFEGWSKPAKYGFSRNDAYDYNDGYYENTHQATKYPGLPASDEKAAENTAAPLLIPEHTAAKFANKSTITAKCESCDTRRPIDALIHIATEGANGHICRKCFNYGHVRSILDAKRTAKKGVTLS